MQVETDPEVLHLRGVLRDLVALSAIPAAWIGSEPPAVAAGLADTLVGLLQLDFAFVRLSDPGGDGAVEVTRGGDWEGFSEWLEVHLAKIAPFPRKEIVLDAGDGLTSRRGFAVPVGVSGEGGVVVAASERSDFPTPIDQLLLSLAANHAAAAFQSARLIHERKRAEDALRKVRDELEERVAERTAELHLSNDELSALRQVATLVASGAPSTEVFEAVAQKVARVLHLTNAAVCRYDDEGSVMTVLAVFGDRPDQFHPGSRWPLDGPSMSAEVLRTGQAVRLEDYEDRPGSLAAAARAGGFSLVVGAPIIVDGRVWGVISTSSPDAPLPDDLEDRLAKFTELVATAIDNSQAHDELTRVAEEQAALRRVATLVAAGAQPAEVFEAVSAEVATLIPADGAALARYESDGTVTALSGWTAEGGYVYVGRRLPLEGTVSTVVLKTGRPGRIDDYTKAEGEAAEAARAMGWRSSVGAPVTVDGRLWGALAIASRTETPLPLDAEQRLTEFTELVATAIAKSEAHEELAQVAQEQAALRRVATLAANGAPPSELVDAVSVEVARLVGADGAAVTRFADDGTFTALGGWSRSGSYEFTGVSFPLEGSMSGVIFDTRRPGRIDSFEGRPGEAAAAMRASAWRSAAGAPITVEGRLWGALVVYSTEAEPLLPETERRLGEFSEIVASAIANTESREEISRLADEQAALRRVATLVAQGVRPVEIFSAVSDELGQLFDCEQAAVGRFEPDGSGVVVVGTSRRIEGVAVGTRWPLEDFLASTVVYKTGRTARNELDDWRDASGPVADSLREIGFLSTVAAPIIVEGSLWGVMTVSDRRGSLPPDTEERVAHFTELVATAIANAENRGELEASRARIVATADATRRRIERDLHDGAQQRLLSLALEVRAAQAGTPPELTEHRAELSHVAEGLTDVLDGLREIALGLHPAILAEGGLGPALNILAQRSPIPVILDIQAHGRLPEHVEVAAYYVASEALTNAAKHSRASQVDLAVALSDHVLRVTAGDDGVGGADPSRGSGLLGLKDRVAAFGGTLQLASRPGEGTTLIAELPLTGDSRT